MSDAYTINSKLILFISGSVFDMCDLKGKKYQYLRNNNP